MVSNVLFFELAVVHVLVLLVLIHLRVVPFVTQNHSLLVVQVLDLTEPMGQVSVLREGSFGNFYYYYYYYYYNLLLFIIYYLLLYC